jgi:FAD/FMN-containing dehydrogenase
MSFITKTFHRQSDLIQHIKTHQPSFYFSSRTSTVIPYDKLEQLLPWTKGDFFLCDLSKIPHEMELTPEGNLKLKGPVSWEEARQFLRSRGRNLKTSPTEQLAMITAGVATSCTGERSFGFGNLRSQIVGLKYLDFNGEEKNLLRSSPFITNSSALKSYQADFSHYGKFKNAPYPRFEQATDLMIGTEGQLGIVTEVEIETVPNFDLTYVFILVPRWEENYQAHLELYQAVQAHRDSILSCELLDSNCMGYLKPEDQLGEKQDVLFLEIKSERFESIYADVLGQLNHIHPDQVFEISENKFHHIRASVPRAIFETNSRMGVVKQGTDCQVPGEKFSSLLDYYRNASHIGIRYCLFGHFGDAHLHFNFMPNQEQSSDCLKLFVELYQKVREWKGSPFAEHGIGLLKQKYIRDFHGNNQLALFQDLKKEHDPYNQFFPQGFMSSVVP